MQFSLGTPSPLTLSLAIASFIYLLFRIRQQTSLEAQQPSTPQRGNSKTRLVPRETAEERRAAPLCSEQGARAFKFNFSLQDQEKHLQTKDQILQDSFKRQRQVLLPKPNCQVNSDDQIPQPLPRKRPPQTTLSINNSMQDFVFKAKRQSAFRVQSEEEASQIEKIDKHLNESANDSQEQEIKKILQKTQKIKECGQQNQREEESRISCMNLNQLAENEREFSIKK